MKSLPAKIKNRINKKLTSLANYHQNIPIDMIAKILKAEGVVLLQEDYTEWSGIFAGREGHAIIELALESSRKDNGYFDIFTPSKTCFMITWYKMTSGNYEIVSYIS